MIAAIETTVEDIALTTNEACELSACEVMIEKGLKTFIEVGIALETIREHRLYRAQYSTFEAYCEARWDMSARYARRICDASNIAHRLKGIGDEPDLLSIPATESQLRPLRSLPPEQHREAWREAIALAGEEKLAARHVQAIVDRITGKEPKPLPSRKTPKVVQPEPESESKPNSEPLPVVIAVTQAVETVASEQSLAKPEPTFIDVINLDTREKRIRSLAEETLNKMRELEQAIGTADSAASAGIVLAIEKIETLKDHLNRVEKLQKSRQ